MIRPIVIVAVLLHAAGCSGPVPTGLTPSPRPSTTGASVSIPATPSSSGDPATPFVRTTPTQGSPPSDPPASTPSVSAGSPIDISTLSGRIAYSYDDGIWVSDATGRNARPLTTDGGFDPTWSPDGRTVVYRRLEAADDGEIWAIDARGGQALDLVDDPRFSDWGPAWSPDGRSIAYDSNRRVGLAVWVMAADGSGQHPVTKGHGEYPSWSPDGRQIAYAGGAYYDIRVVDADGSNDRPITSHAAYEMAPAWSPDGRWIAYETQADYFPRLLEPGMGPEMEIHLIRPDGTDDHRITTDRVEDGFPAWSPDGRYLMWARHGELVVARPDGSGMTAVVHGNFPSWIP